MRNALVALVLAMCLAVAACGADRPVTGLRVMVPNNPGSGYDVTARSAVLAMEQAGLARNVEVFNLPGASGAVGLQRLVNERGNGGLLLQMGLGVVGAVHTTRSPVSFADTTPIARLTEDPEAVTVAADSPYRTLDELTTAWRADPLRVAVAGGSSPGGPDHLATHLLAGSLDWATELGARNAYLQVEDGNAGAIAMYEKLGFRLHHRYRYYRPTA